MIQRQENEFGFKTHNIVTALMNPDEELVISLDIFQKTGYDKAKEVLEKAQGKVIQTDIELAAIRAVTSAASLAISQVCCIVSDNSGKNY